MKKKVLFHSNYHKLFTGFGKNSKNILKYLHQTGKYDLVELANGRAFDDPELKKLPWKALGMMPRADQKINPEEQKAPDFQRKVAYGQYGVDKIIEEEKPDVYIGVEDIWAFDGFSSKKWWKKINSMIWTTLDSLPILPTAIESSKHTKNFYTWASFASKKMNEMGHENVKTLNGSIDTSNFSRLTDSQRKQLRTTQSIPEDAFVIGFVFRNQLRKSVPNILDGFKIFIEENPDCNARLLLHTHWSEGWDINRLIDEKGIDKSLILTTYFCDQCKRYEIKPFQGQKLNCRFCGSQGSQETTNILKGVSEDQLNEVYNLMDVYCHPFTSGGMEIPVFEAKLTELITLVTNYSCGEDSCTEESGGFPLDWSEYREPGTQFIKATTSPISIARYLKKVFKMPSETKRKREKQSREFVIKNYSCEVIGKQLEKIIDDMPEVDWDFDLSQELRDPLYNPPEIVDDIDWLQDIYQNILKVEVDANDKGLQDWLIRLKNGDNRQNILNFFRQTAVKENKSLKKIDFEELLGEIPQEERIGLVVAGGEEEVLFANSLLNGISEQYPNHKIYAILNEQFFPLINSHPNVHKCIPFSPQCKDPLLMEGKLKHQGYFDICFTPEISVDHGAAFHNGKSNCAFDLKDF